MKDIKLTSLLTKRPANASRVFPALTWIEQWVANWLFRRVVSTAKGNQINQLNATFALLHQAALNEYYEDNSPTVDCFLRERMTAGIAKSNSLPRP